MENRLLSAEKLESEENDMSIRPAELEEYIGQQEVKENLEIFIKAAKMREEPLDHVLLYGPPGLGIFELPVVLLLKKVEI